MPSLFSHASVAMALGSAVAPRPLLRPFLVAGAACALLPDLDIIGPGGIAFLGGHRGFTHSFTFAALVGLASVAIVFRRPPWRGARVRLLLFIAVATATHGSLDAITSVPRGVQLLSPFSLHQYRFPLLRSGVEELIRLFIPSVLFLGLVLYLRGCRLPRLTRDVVLSIREESVSLASSDEISRVASASGPDRLGPAIAESRRPRRSPGALRPQGEPPTARDTCWRDGSH